MGEGVHSSWPVLTRYDQDHLVRIALPLGGIGTGTVSLGGRGDLRDWEIVNRPAKGFRPVIGREGAPFFALFAQTVGGERFVRIVEGPLDFEDYEGSHGSIARNHGLPRFRDCSFAAAYPFGQVILSDPDVPLDVRIQAYNPLVPGDADRSGVPVAVLRFLLDNPTDGAITASVCGSIPNFIGQDGSIPGRDWRGEEDFSVGPRANRNEFRKCEGGAAAPGIAGIFMRSEGVDPRAEQWGTIALSATSEEGVSFRTAWAELSWGDALLDFWDDFGSDGQLTERAIGDADAPVASLAVKVNVPPYAVRDITFLLTWHFPNRRTWTPADCCEDDACCPGDRVGNYYATQYHDAWDVAVQVADALPEGEAETLKFVRAFCDSDLPQVVKEAALYNLSTLRSQSCFRTEDGRFYGFEGCSDHTGCCLGSCTHVWNYEQATAFLFGDLAKSMRETEFAHATQDDGLMSFRVHLPLERAREQGLAAADGQMGCLMKLYRDWRLSGDDAMLKALWPQARRALEFCWAQGGWDADVDGVMEGCQHNTMDVEYYGPNPQMETWYLGALRAVEEMAKHLGHERFAARCHDLFERGSQWTDEHLFNGEYYEQDVRPPSEGAIIAPGLRIGMGAEDLQSPAMQLGAGCLVDQLVGQYMAHVCGLGYLLDPDRVSRTLQSIAKYNFREGFHDHFNHMRSFILGDESGLLMATYPRGRRPQRPFPYYNEVMTGFEYTAAIHMLYEGQISDGLRVIQAIRDRYDGRKRSPFDEAECGHHYARAMASWAAVLALTGFDYSGVDGAMSFAARDGLHFWSNGYAWGTCGQRSLGSGVQIELHVLRGRLRLDRLEVRGIGEASLGTNKTIDAGEGVLVLLRSH
jgi:non-lysosomal glucosylceramidase